MKLYLIQEVCILLFVGVCEACIDIGLIPSNSGYKQILEHSDWNVVIAGKEGEKAISSGNMEDVSVDMLRDTIGKSTPIGNGRVLTSFPIRGGVSGWVADVSELERINNEIIASTRELEIENGVIREGESLRLKRITFETQNRLYDSIIPTVTPQLSKIRDLLEQPDEEKLFMAMVLCVYVKRRFNLAIVTDNTEIADIGELWLAIRETIEVLQDTGISAFINTCDHADVRADRLIASYDFFEDVVEKTLPGIRSLFVNLTVEDGRPELRILADSGDNIDFDAPYVEKMKRLGAVITDELEDGTNALSLSFGEGGAV